MYRIRAYQKRKTLFIVILFILIIIGMGIRIIWMVETDTSLIKGALDTEQRERGIKAARGKIYDRNGVILADNVQVCTISVIHNQIDEPERVISELSEILGISEEKVRERVEKRSSIEIIKTNVSLEDGDRIRQLRLQGVKVDTDYRRYYVYPSIMSRMMGFTGAYNQGIVGLETVYDELLTGENGTIYTYTDARENELDELGQTRDEALSGKNLYLTIDLNIQKYISSVAVNTRLATDSKTVSIVVMNPSDGEILGMTTAPEYNNQEPFEYISNDAEVTMDLLNEMWRNPLVSDSYEPGSTFKIITATAALETGSSTLASSFYCSGGKNVGDRIIHCHQRNGHGSVTFKEALAKSCNVALMDMGLGLGIDRLYKYMRLTGLMEKTGIDLPGEGNSIMHKQDEVKEVDLAAMSFGQSFQITPMQLIRAVSCCINGGKLITPHVGMMSEQNFEDGSVYAESLVFPEEENVISTEISKTMQELLLNVVDNGTGKNAKVEGFSIGGKTATSEKLPRSDNKYIASFIGFAPADDPKVLVFVMIDEPQGAYYGGTIAAPVAAEIFENILPYFYAE